jgi:CRISPR-associated protein Csd1
MLLQRLVEYAQSSSDVVPAFYARKPVRYVLDIDSDGKPRGELTPLGDTSLPDQRFGVPRLVPAITRTVAIAPTIAVDTPEYVFGWVAQEAKPDRVAQQHAAFRELAEQWAKEEDDVAGPAHAVHAFYRDGHHVRVAQPSEWTRSDLVALRVNGMFACETGSAQRFWATVAGGRKGLGRSGVCLVCGRNQPLLKTIPQQVQQRWVPGATQSASLVSVNEAVHGFELQKFLGHTPICVDCGLRVMAALTALLSSPTHSSSYSGQDARIAWWLTGHVEFDVMGLLDRPDEGQVQQLLRSATLGELLDSDRLSMFCAVVVGGNVARVVVREWIELPLPKVKQNLAAWFEDLAMVDVWTATPKPIGVPQLARVTGRWQAGRGEAGGSWAKFGASGSDRPQGIYQALLRSALLGKTLPPKLLTHVIARIRNDGRIDTARVALIRLALRRHHTTTDPEVYMPTLNLDNLDPAFVSGRLFAVLEDLQRAVQSRRGGEPLNVTFTDRYFARAVTSPMVALVAGRRDARAWLKRLRRDRPNWAAAYERRLDELFSQLPADAGGMLLGAVITQQAKFILGYHQQRAALRAERIQAAAGNQTDLPPDTGEPVPAAEGESE